MSLALDQRLKVPIHQVGYNEQELGFIIAYWLDRL